MQEVKMRWASLCAKIKVVISQSELSFRVCSLKGFASWATQLTQNCAYHSFKSIKSLRFSHHLTYSAETEQNTPEIQEMGFSFSVHFELTGTYSRWLFSGFATLMSHPGYECPSLGKLAHRRHSRPWKEDVFAMAIRVSCQVIRLCARFIFITHWVYIASFAPQLGLNNFDVCSLQLFTAVMYFPMSTL